MSDEKQHLQTILERAGFECRSYSGRGMYGKSCLAITTNDCASFSEALSLLLGTLFDAGFDLGQYDASETAADVTRALERVRVDSLGTGSVFYFPGVPFEP